MKRHLLFTLLLAAFVMPFAAQAQSTDTLGYDNGTWDGTVCDYKPMYWGIRITPNQLVHHRTLTDVMVFVPSGASSIFTLQLWRGGSTRPTTFVDSVQFTPTSVGAWNTFHLTTPHVVDTLQPLWILFRYNLPAGETSVCPAAGCYYVGNSDGSWASDDEGTSWVNIATVSSQFYYTWMIRGIFTTTGSTHHMVVANSNNTSMGTVSGTGTYAHATNATLTATANNGYRFVRWNDSVTTNPRTITVMRDTTFTAYFEALPSGTHMVTVNVNNDIMGYATGGGQYTHGTNALLTAVANDGYRFVRWNDRSTTNPRTITVMSDTLFTAYFEIIVNDEGIDEIEGAYIRTLTIGNTIEIVGAENLPVWIYTIDGRCLVNGVRNNRTFSMPSSGIYLVRVGDTPTKRVIITQ